MPLPEFFRMVWRKIALVNRNPQVNGIIYLKGGDVEEELSQINATAKIYPLAEIFHQPFFETKKIIHIYNLQVSHIFH